MNETEETTERLNGDPVLRAITELSKRFDSLESRFGNLESKFDNLEARLNNFEESANVQLEAIRTGIVANGIAFERLAGKVYLMSANVTEMREELNLRSRETVL